MVQTSTVVRTSTTARDFDPRDGEEGLRYLQELNDQHDLQGAKLYTAEWRNDSKGRRLDAPEAFEHLEKARATEIVTETDDRLFVGPDGEAIDPPDFESVHRRARLARANVSGQGEICAQLHEARNGVDAAGE